MGNVAEFGKWIKATYRAYLKYKDEEVGQVLMEKRPDLYQYFVNQTADPLVDQVIELQNHKSEGTWAITDRVRADRRLENTHVIEARNLQAEGLIGLKRKELEAREVVHQLHNQPTLLARQDELMREQHALNLLNYQTQRRLTALASEKDMDYPTFLEGKKKELLDELELKKLRAEAEDEIRLAIIAAYLEEHQKISQLQVYLDSLYEQVYEIEISDRPAGVKQRMISSREETIKTMEKDKREREKKLLQAYSGERAKRIHAQANPQGDPQETLGTDELRVPSKGSGRGRRKSPPA